MVTTFNRSQLIRRGKAYQPRVVIAQAHYTFGLLDRDDKVREALGAPFINEAKAALKRLEDALRDRGVVTSAAKAATRGQNTAVAVGRKWSDFVVNRCRAGIRRGIPVPPEAAQWRRSWNPGVVAQEIERLAKLAQDHLEAFASVGVNAAVVARGVELGVEVRAADQAQELELLSHKPVTVQLMRELTAVVYVAVKVVNDFARSLYGVGSPYHLAILHRKMQGPTEEGSAEPNAPPLSATSPPTAEAS